MIHSTLCNTCLQVFRILVEAEDIGLVKQMQTQEDGKLVPCPRLCGGNISLANDALIDEMSKDPRLKPPLKINAKELYKAVNGAGLPDEIPTSAEVIRLVLSSDVPVFVDVEKVDQDLYIHELRFKNGMTLHLGAGARGAQVVKITKAGA